MVDSVKNAISRIETPKARKPDILSDKSTMGLIQHSPVLWQAILLS